MRASPSLTAQARGQVTAWACELAAWFALTEGRYTDVIDYARAGQQLAGVSHAMVQLVLQEARGQARLGQRREVRASLDRGTKLLEQLPRPDHPEHHFVFDHTKWIFYAATCYTYLDHDLQERYASERLIEPFHERYCDERRAYGTGQQKTPSCRHRHHARHHSADCPDVTHAVGDAVPRVGRRAP